MGVMAQQAEHDEIGIEAVQTVSGVGVAAMSALVGRLPSPSASSSLVRLSLGKTDKFLNLVLAFSWDLQSQLSALVARRIIAHVVSAQDDLYIPPLGILRDALSDIILEMRRKACHEGSTYTVSFVRRIRNAN